MEETPTISMTLPQDIPPSSPPAPQPPAAKTEKESPPFRASLRRLSKSVPNNLQDLYLPQHDTAENRTTAGGEVREISASVIMNKDDAKAIRKASISKVVEGTAKRERKDSETKMKVAVVQAIALFQYQEAAREAGLGSKWTFVVEDVKAVEEKRKWCFE